MASNILKQLFNFSTKLNSQTISCLNNARLLSTTNRLYGDPDGIADRKHELSVMDYYFKREKKKDRKKFVELIELFKHKKFRTGHVEFVYCALKRMYDYGLQEDLDIYKKIIDVMPKEKMIPESLVQADTMYYPRHQMAITDLLVQMEENGKPTQFFKMPN